VNNILIARGEVVVVDDKYAVKISELNPQPTS
jgi:flagellar motor switch/type III secretory pathway protein FliN